MGIGPNGTSLLNKLGLKRIDELSDEELTELVRADRTRRSQERALGRARRIMKKVKGPERVQTLESMGLDSKLIIKLRASGKSEGELVEMLKRL